MHKIIFTFSTKGCKLSLMELMLTFLKGVNAITSYDIKCWWQSNFSFTTCHYYCMVNALFHHAAICPFTCLKKVAKIVIWDFVLTLIWHANNQIFHLHFLKLLSMYHSTVKLICVFLRVVQVWIGNWDGIYYLNPHLLIQRTTFWNYSSTRCGTCNCAYLL